jgi:hypothetical protein
METEEMRRLRFEVLKMATQDHFCHGEAAQAVAAAEVLWAFVRSDKAICSPEQSRPAA